METTNKEQWNELHRNNKKLSRGISSLEKGLDKNSKQMQLIISNQATEIQSEFFKDESPLKIKISSIYDLNLMAKLVERKPVEFVRKCLIQYNPIITPFKEYIASPGKSLLSWHALDPLSPERYGIIYMKCPGINVKASEDNGSPYKDCSYEGCINLSLGNTVKEVMCCHWELYNLLTTYYCCSL
ncbi:MAG: hypothetical protein LBD50_03360 [Rickettsiales bacterium]|jgi:hypothetical protein|nr:hypothetical protein [Rickettsiales bacterium]